jgi:hypothetical protein
MALPVNRQMRSTKKEKKKYSDGELEMYSSLSKRKILIKLKKQFNS